MTLRSALLAGLALLSACSRPAEAPQASAAKSAEVVNVYSGRHYDADTAIFKAFTEKTGIQVRQLQAPGDELLERLKAEGAASPADLALGADAGNLWRLKQAGLLQPVSSAALDAAVPAADRDPEGQWYAFSKRARVIVYKTGAIDPGLIQTYDSLASPALKGKVCARSSTNLYNLSLLSARIARYGEEKALAWAKGVAANFARQPQGADTDQILAVATGECTVALVNHYYLLRLQASPDAAQREAALKVSLILPDQNGVGTHVNFSGGGVTAHAPHKENAIKLLEFLETAESQKMFADLNDEFPVLVGTPTPPALSAIATFKQDATDPAALGANQARAQVLFDQAGWR
jgi:iron(III) transport system substrate-binding protein